MNAVPRLSAPRMTVFRPEWEGDDHARSKVSMKRF